MDIEAREKRIQELENLLAHYARCYYNGQPEISDAEYDELESELRDLDADNAILRRVGADPESGSKKIKHKAPVGSLNKIHTIDEATKWHWKHQKAILVQPKLDGLTIVLYYEKRQLCHAVTRGNGFVGVDVTKNISKAQGVPKQIQYDKSVAVRCEAVIAKDIFQKVFATDYANARNAASGIVNRKDGAHAEHLRLIAFDIQLFDEPAHLAINFFSWLKTNGFIFAPTNEIFRPGLKELPDLIDQYTESRDAYEYDIDGLVLKFAHLSDRNQAPDELRPSWAIAYKFANQEAYTKIIDIQWSVGKTGRINPIAILEPVNVGGVTISRCTLNNIAYIEALGIGPGDTVLVARCNDVIPKIEAVVTKAGNPAFKAPTKCPVSGKPTVRKGRFIFSPEPEESQIRSMAIEAWIVIHEIKHFGPALQDALSAELNGPADLYRLTEKDITSKAGWGAKSAQKILDEIGEKRQTTLPKLLTSLAITALGPSRAQNIGDKCTIQELLEIIEKSDAYSFLEKIPAIGAGSAKEIIDGLRLRKQMIIDLVSVVEITKPVSTTQLAEYGFLFTGKLNTMKRKDAQDIVAKYGGSLKWDRSKNYLVTNDPESGSNKNQKAIAQGVKIINEQQFVELVKKLTNG